MVAVVDLSVRVFDSRGRLSLALHVSLVCAVASNLTHHTGLTGLTPSRKLYILSLFLLFNDI